MPQPVLATRPPITAITTPFYCENHTSQQFLHSMAKSKGKSYVNSFACYCDNHASLTSCAAGHGQVQGQHTRTRVLPLASQRCSAATAATAVKPAAADGRRVHDQLTAEHDVLPRLPRELVQCREPLWPPNRLDRVRTAIASVRAPRVLLFSVACCVRVFGCCRAACLSQGPLQTRLIRATAPTAETSGSWPAPSRRAWASTGVCALCVFIVIFI